MAACKTHGIVFAFFLLFAVFSPLNARAEVSIAVVDVDVILSKSLAAQSIKKQADEKRNAFLAVVKKEEDALRAQQKDIETKRADMSKDDLLKKVRALEEDGLKARAKIQKSKAALDQSYSEGMNTLRDTVFQVCREIADEQAIDLIITKQNIIVGNKDLNITQSLMERLNKKLPDIKLKEK